uniref:Uncharacterized protein n=1 Tax=Prymnesium polylepis TaxID=72548 RepID=A0A7S4M6N0_9EUKA
MKVQLAARMEAGQHASAQRSPLENASAKYTVLCGGSTANEFDSWMGKHPDPVDIEAAATTVWGQLDATPFGAGADQLGGPRAVAETVVKSLSAGTPYTGGSRDAALADVYRLTLAKLAALQVDTSRLHVVSVICAGGTPWATFGLGGGTAEKQADNQANLALRHGVLFDLLPLFLTDFSGSILGLAVGTAALCLAKLRARDRGALRCDDLLFACKGTLGAALVSGAFAAEATGDDFRLVGLGTDLSQGFDPASGAPWPLLVLNSEQDDNIGAARTSLDKNWASRHDGDVDAPRARSKPEFVWYNIDGWLSSLGWPANPYHKWYFSAFYEESAVTLREDVMRHISLFIQAQPTSTTNITPEPRPSLCVGSRHMAHTAVCAEAVDTCSGDLGRSPSSVL